MPAHESGFDLGEEERPAGNFPLPVPRVLATFPSVTERYFEVRYFVPEEERWQKVEPNRAGDQVVLFHSNKLCMISLAPEHEVLKAGKVITSVDFVGGSELDIESLRGNGKRGGGNRLMNKVSGKFKKGGQKLKPDSILCLINCSDGSSYTVLSGITGNLIEINQRLLEKPQLITEKPWSNGYIALACSTLTHIRTMKETMLDHVSYTKQLALRGMEEGDGFKKESIPIESEEGENQQVSV